MGPFLFLTLACSLSQGPDRGPAVQEARAVVERAVQALGGEARLRPVRAMKVTFRGAIRIGDDLPFVVEAWSDQPQRSKQVMRLELNGTKVAMTHVLDGDKAWMAMNDTVQDLGAETLASLKTDLYVNRVAGLLPLLDDKAYTLTLVGELKVRGRSAVGVKVTRQGQPDVTVHFDKADGLPVHFAYRHRDPQNGEVGLREQVMSDYREVNPAAAEEQVLRAARVGLDGPALLEFLRRQTRALAGRDKIKALIRDLGDPSFKVRERAQQQLVALDVAAVPLLAQAVHDPDPEVVTRAKQCLQSIGKTQDTSVPVAAVRLVAQRRPAGAVPVLADYLAAEPGDPIGLELEAALVAVALRDGKPDPDLTRALADPDPRRRAAIAAVIGHDGQPVRERPGRRIFPQGIKRAMKGTQYQAGQKTVEWEVTDVKFFNKLDDRVFAKP